MKNNNTKISILVAEDHDLYRESLKEMIQFIFEEVILYEAINGIEALQKIEENNIDVALVDLNMPEMNGYELIDKLALLPHRPKIIVNSVDAFGSFIRNSFRNEHIEGYFIKTNRIEELTRGLQVVFEGGCYFAESLNLVIRKSDIDSWELVDTTDVVLTNQEQNVLMGICEQKTNAEIADSFFLSVNTIKTHRRNIKKKLNISQTAGLVVYALKEGIFRLTS